MPRELPSYRDNLEHLNELLPNCELLTRVEIMQFTKKDRKTVNKLFPFSGKYITKPNFARMLASMGGAE